MEGTYYRIGKTLLTILLFACFQVGRSQILTRDIIYRSYITGNMSKWEKVIRQLEQENQNNAIGRLELVNCYYGYTGWLIKEEEEDLAEEYIRKAEKLIDKILELEPKNATVWAYKGAFIGLDIGMHTYKAMVLGPKSIEYIDKAIALDADNIQGQIEKGNASYYTPGIFGGSKPRAIEAYKNAIRLMELKGMSEHNWMYLNSLTILAQAYEKTDQPAMAEQTYKKILKIEPDFKWVKEELYPAFRKKFTE